MKRGWGLTGKIAALAGGLLIAFFIFFAISHGCWYDDMKADEKVKFWTDFGVSFGTIALALVTGASVYETQQVVAGEDRRFRQSRIPTVLIAENATQWWRVEDHAGFILMLENLGDGPAVNVKLTLEAHVHYLLTGRDDNGQNFTDRPSGDEPIRLKEEFVASFLPVKVQHRFAYDLKYREKEFRVNYPDGIDFRSMKIRFEDTFGASYSVKYPDFKNRPNHFERVLPESVN